MREINQSTKDYIFSIKKEENLSFNIPELKPKEIIIDEKDIEKIKDIIELQILVSDDDSIDSFLEISKILNIYIDI